VYQTSQAADQLLGAISDLDPRHVSEVLGREAAVLESLDRAAGLLSPRDLILLTGMQHLRDGRGVLLPAAIHALHSAHVCATAGSSGSGRGWRLIGWESWPPDPATGDTELGRLLSPGLARRCRQVLIPGARPQRSSSGGEAGAEAADDRHDRPSLATSYAEPSNEFESVIAAIWQELLGIERIGVHDNFFDLGGDSLVATQITARLRQAFSVDVPLRRLLEGQTIAELARIVLEELTKGLDEGEMTRILSELEG
jgi:acyl carrier protein